MFPYLGTKLYPVLVFFLCFCLNSGLCSHDVTIRGNEHFRTGKIKSFVFFPKSFSTFSKWEIQQWINAVRTEVIYEYENAGFFDITVGVDVRKDSVKGKDRWASSIIIQEGARYRFGRVELVTTDGSSPLMTPEALRTKPEMFFNSEKTNRDKRDIEKRYGDLGYAKRRVKQDYIIRDSLKTIDVVFTVDPSYLVVFDTLIVKNRREKISSDNPGVSDETLIRRILKMKRGDTVRLSETNKYKAKLKSTRIFNHVRLKDSLLTDNMRRSALMLSLEERVPGRINSALFWETEDGFGVEAGWAHKNILGNFYDGRANVRIAQRRQNINTGLGNPLLFGFLWRWDNDLDLIWRQDPNENQSSFDAIFSSSLSHPFARWARYVGTVEFEGTTQKIPVPSTLGDTITIEKSRVINLNAISSIIFTFVDNEFNPHKGSRFTLIFGNGGPFIDEDDEFHIASLRHNWLEIKTSCFLPLARAYTGAFRLNGGMFTNNGRSNSRRFFLGGRNSIRNLEYRELCPERDIVIEGGDTTIACIPEVTPLYYLTSLELRMGLLSRIRFNPDKFWKNFQHMQVVPFVDMGQVWEAGKPQNPEGRGADVGLGLRLPITVFNFRFDYAVGWDDGPEWRKSKFLIDLAQAF
ncbi:outer membrane protein assembly factor [Fibrobacterota bacterium]